MLKPVPRTTLSQKILDEIMQAIKSGVWKPGSKIPSEQELATSLSVSRNSIREAIKTLNNKKVLESHPGQGTFLSKDAMRYILSSELIDRGYKDASLFEIVETRALIGSQCAYWAAERATEEDLDRLRELLQTMRDSVGATVEEQDRIHDLFHEEIIRMSKNSFIIRLLSSVQAEVEAQREKVNLILPSGVPEMLEDQEGITNAICARKPEEAREAMKRHLDRGIRVARQIMDERDRENKK